MKLCGYCEKELKPNNIFRVKDKYYCQYCNRDCLLKHQQTIIEENRQRQREHDKKPSYNKRLVRFIT